MGYGDYNNGYENPYAPVDHTKPGSFDFQQGQYAGQEAGKNSVGAGHGAVGSAPSRVAPDPSAPLCTPRKSQFLGIVCCVFGGPLGLFYASKKLALMMLVAVAAAFPMLATPDHSTVSVPDTVAGLLTTETLWPLAAAVSVILSILIISGHNRRAAAMDATALAAWQFTRQAAPTN